MSNVVSIDTFEPLDVQGDVVQLLENLLADAKAGYLTAIACATVMSDGGTGYAIQVGTHQTHLTASTGILFHRVMGGNT